ncbi:MAG: hypothetical protein GXZ08_05825 [Tissierellia bacterium]|nr:hypothetical protein [Tissierellia bacterium]
MYSDIWLQEGYKSGDRIVVSDEVDYKIWTNLDGEIIGVSVNYERADDFHYDLPIEEWTKFLEKVLGNADMNHTQKLFEDFLKNNPNLFSFEDALKDNNIKYDKIAFYDGDIF